jgi:RNA polymerase sigma factor (sigma-70 family)
LVKKSFISFFCEILTTQLKESITAEDVNISTDQQQDVNAILKEIDSLSEEKQEILKMRFWGDLKFSEIAEKLNKNEAAVKKMFYRSIEELKNKLK